MFYLKKGIWSCTPYIQKLIFPIIELVLLYWRSILYSYQIGNIYITDIDHTVVPTKVLNLKTLS